MEKDSAFKQFRTLDELGDAITSESGRFGTFRAERRKLYDGLAKSIRPLESFLRLAQGSIGTTPFAPAAVVFGAASYLFTACEYVSKAYDGLEELFEQISQVTIRLKEYESGQMEASLKAEIRGILAYVLIIIGKSEAF